jgi:hypothetical protein
MEQWKQWKQPEYWNQGRKYRVKFKCPKCGKPYAKPNMGVKHLQKHIREEQEKRASQ